MNIECSSQYYTVGGSLLGIYYIHSIWCVYVNPKFLIYPLLSPFGNRKFLFYVYGYTSLL